MSVYIFALGIKAANGLVKSTINTANAFVDSGVNTTIINILGKNGGFDFLDPAFEIDERISCYSLDALSEKFATVGQRKQNFYIENQQFLKVHYHDGHKKALQLINDNLTENDLVIFSHPLALAIFCQANPIRKATTIIQVHGNYIEEIDNLDLIRGYINDVDYIQVVSLYMKDDLVELLNFPENKVRCIYNITKPIYLQKRSDGITKRVSIIGSIQKRKNQLDAIKMLHLIKDRNVILQIFGKTLKQDYMDMLKSFIEIYRLQDRVVFCGLATEREIYENTDIVIMTSDHEGFPYIFMESSVYGIPIVSYDFKYGAKEFTCDNQNGCLVEMGDYTKMAQVVSDLLNDYEKYKKTVEFNRINFSIKYREDLILDSYHQLFKNFNHNEDLKFPEPIQNLSDFLNISDINLKLIKLPTKKPWQETIIEEDFFNVSFLVSLDESKLEFYYIYNKSRFPVSAFLKEVEEKDSNIRSNILKNSKKDILVNKKKYYISLNIPIANRISFGEPMNKISLGISINSRDLVFANIVNGELQEETANYESVYLNMKNLTGFKKIRDVLHIMRPDGFYIRYPKFDAIKSIKNEEGERLPFSTHILRVYGKEYLFFKLKLGLYKKLIVLMNDNEKLELDFSEYSYKSIFEKISNLEIEYNLYDMRIFGVFAWELIRAPVFEHILEACGVLDKHFGKPNQNSNRYFGNKSLNNIQVSEKLIFEFPRKKDIDYKTISLQKVFSSNATVLEYPQDYGYSGYSYDNNTNVYPIYDFLEYSAKNTPIVEFSGVDKSIIRWLKKLFIAEFGLDIEFSLFLKARIIKFKKEYNYFNDFFVKNKFREVMIPSAYWSAGIIAAAKKNGIITSDIQYALISKYHPSFSFPVKARAYGSDRIYLWSKYWNIKEIPYNKSIVLDGNYFKEKLLSLNIICLDADNLEYDVVFVSQSRVGRKIFNFMLDYAKCHNNKRIVFCPHPDEIVDNYLRFAELAELTNIIISNEDTLVSISRGRNVVGVYSTSLIEAVALGKPVYLLQFIGGYEVLEREFGKGLMQCVDTASKLDVLIKDNEDKILYNQELVKILYNNL